MAINSDLIIIGAGPGGYELAAEASLKGLTVTLIERDLLGGTCLNRGCIPTKTLCAAASIVSAVRNSDEWGIKTDMMLDIGAIADRKDKVVAALRDGVATLLNNDKITIVNGEAKFVGSKTVSVGDDTYSAPAIVVATGSAPRLLPIPGAELALSSDDILALRELPKSLCVIGGGVIGMEYASIFSSFGVEVTVLEYCKEILPPFDKDIAKRLRQVLSRRGADIVTQAAVNGIVRKGDDLLEVTYDHKGKPKSVESAMVLMSVGRCAVVPEGLAAIGVTVGRHGVEVDENMMTSVPGVYAIGDVNGRCMLAHAATAQGRLALDHIMGEKPSVNIDVVPSAVFTVPEAAMVGLTEEACEQQGLEVEVKKAFFRSNGKAVAMGETDGIIKMIVERSSRRLLGCHILGAHAADLIQEPTTVMANGLTVDAIKRSIHGHPTLTEVVQAAAAQF